jgi:hypothetical protein
MRYETDKKISHWECAITSSLTALIIGLELRRAGDILHYVLFSPLASAFLYTSLEGNSL